MEMLLVTLLTILAAGVGTLTGFGTSTIMVPVLLLWFPVPETLLFVGIIHWFGDIWKMALFREGFRWRIILLFGVPGILLSYVGARFVFSVPETLLSHILGGFLVVYVAYLAWKPTFRIPPNTLNAMIGGGLSGFFSGVFGVGGAVRGAFLSAFDLPKTVYIATAGAIGLAVDSSRLITYFSEGAILPRLFLLALILCIPASLVGAHLAKRIVAHISEQRFRTVVAVFLLLVGLKLVLWP
ncbi:MAG: sulfite exporter TauE/SafE family protein [Candidatus Kerfeldbacteria bacterium]|nr:sulfite exporter TauE/SafE family protein [Candidatus Kerfeldbacteria bacterium]